MTDTSVVPFLFEGDTLIRKVNQNDEPWFDAGDICRALGIKNPSMAVRRLDQDEKGLRETDTPGGKQDVLLVSESGLYALVLRSHMAMKPGTKAHRFRKWVTSELLPAIRKTGRYDRRHRQADDEMSQPLSEKRLIVNMFTKIGGPRAGAEKALQLGFKSVPAIEAMLAQKQFSFVVDLDEAPPAASEAVN